MNPSIKATTMIFNQTIGDTYTDMNVASCIHIVERGQGQDDFSHHLGGVDVEGDTEA